MLDAEKMTPQELRELANKKEKDIVNKIIKIGYLKENIYFYYNEPTYSDGIKLTVPISSTWSYHNTDTYMMTTTTYFQRDVDELVENYRRTYKKFACKGDKAIGIYRYGTIHWYVENAFQKGYYFEDRWANRNLENIEDVNEINYNPSI